MSTLVLRNEKGDRVKIVPQNQYYIVVTRQQSDFHEYEMTLHDLLRYYQKWWFGDLTPVAGDLSEWEFLFKFMKAGENKENWA